MTGSDSEHLHALPPHPASVSTEASPAQLVLVKNHQRYVFRYTPGDETSLLDSLIEMARDPDSDLTWFDAAMLSHQMGRQISQRFKQIIHP